MFELVCVFFFGGGESSLAITVCRELKEVTLVRSSISHFTKKCRADDEGTTEEPEAINFKLTTTKTGLTGIFAAPSSGILRCTVITPNRQKRRKDQH